MKSVLVAGDAMVDEYWHGSITRISPEAPVPVFAVDRIESRMGGAANVMENIKAMGVQVYSLYSETFWNGGIIAKRRLVAKAQQFARVDSDINQFPLSANDVSTTHADIVVLSDYGKGTLDKISAIISQCKSAGKTVLVDPKARRFTDYSGCDMLKPNLAEMRPLIGGWSSEEDLRHKVKAMQRRAGIQTVLLTRGAEGMTLFNGSVSDIACAREQIVVDVSGAGDTAIAAYAAALARGMSPYDSAVVAVRASAVAVSRFGTTVVTEAEAFG